MLPVAAAATSGGGASLAAVAPYLAGFLGAGGLIGAITTLAKLRGERNTLAVTQAQGAVDAMSEIVRELRHELLECERDTATATASLEDVSRRYDELRDRYAAVEERWGPFVDPPADAPEAVG